MHLAYQFLRLGLRIFIWFFLVHPAANALAQSTPAPLFNWPQKTIFGPNEPHEIVVTDRLGKSVEVRVQGGPAKFEGFKLVVTNTGIVRLIAGTQTAFETKSFNVPTVRFTNEGSYDTRYSSVNAVGFHNGHVYATVGNELVVLPSTNVAVRIGSLSLTGLGGSIVFRDSRALIRHSDTVSLIDISNPKQPKRLQSVAAPRVGSTFSLKVSGATAFLASDNDVHILDLSVPTNIRMAGSFGIGAMVRDFDVADGVVYVIGASGQLRIFDVSGEPLEIGNYVLPHLANRIRVIKNRLITGGSGVHFYRLERGSTLIKLGSLPETDLYGFGALEPLPSGHAIAIDGARGSVIDYSDAQNPVRIATLPSSGHSALAVEGNNVILGNISSALQKLSVGIGYPDDFQSLPTTIAASTDRFVLPAQTTNGMPISYAVLRGPARIDTGTVVFDGTGPVTIRALQPDSSFFFPIEKEFTVYHGGFPQRLTWEPLPISDGKPSWRVKSDSGLPIRLTYISGPAVVENDTVVGTAPGIARVRAEQEGDDRYAAIIRTEALTMGIPVLRSGGTALTTFIVDVRMRNDLAYISHWAGFSIVDVSDPEKPRIVGSLSDSSFASCRTVEFSKDRAFALLGGKISAVDISDPTIPKTIGITTNGGYTSLSATDDLLAAANSLGIQLLTFGPDFRELANIDFPARHVFCTGKTVYAVSANAIAVIDITVPTQPQVVNVKALALSDGETTRGVVWDREFSRAFLFTGTSWGDYIETIDLSDNSEVIIGPRRPVDSAYSNRPEIKLNGPHAFIPNFSTITIADLPHGTPSRNVMAPTNAYALRVASSGDAVVVGTHNGIYAYALEYWFSNTLDLTVPASLYVTNTIVLPPTSSSGMPVRYSVSGPAIVSANRLRFLRPGTVDLKVDQDDNEVYQKLTNRWTINVRGLPQRVIWSGDTNKTIAPQTKLPVWADLSSGLTPMRLIVGPAIWSNGELTITAPGPVKMIVEHPGTDLLAPVRSERIINLAEVRIDTIRTVLSGIPTPARIAFTNDILHISSARGYEVHRYSEGAFVATGSLALSGYPGRIQDMSVHGNSTYLAYELVYSNFFPSSGIKIIDTSDLSQLKYTAEIDPSSSYYSVEPGNGSLYVDGNVLDLGNPSKPTWRGTTDSYRPLAIRGA